MAKRRKEYRESNRWPRCFARPEECQSLVAHPAWQKLVEDLKQHREELSRKLVNNIAPSLDVMALQNADRGIIAGYERVIEFEEDLKAWIEDNK